MGDDLEDSSMSTFPPRQELCTTSGQPKPAMTSAPGTGRS